MEKIPDGKAESPLSAASTRLSSNTSLAGVTAVSGIQQALVDHFASSRLELSAGFCPILFLSLSLAQYLPFSVFFLSASVFYYKCLRGPLAKSYKARLYPALMNARARNLMWNKLHI